MTDTASEPIVSAQREPMAGPRLAVVIAAAASALAGLIHIVAASNHEGDATLVWMFGLAAAAQMGWSVVVVRSQSRATLVAGVVINGGALIVWALSRTVGVPLVDALADPEPVSSPDLSAAVFAALSAGAAAVMLLRPNTGRLIRPRLSAALATIAILAALPALAADHNHSGGDGHVHAGAAHDHDEMAAGDDHADGHDDDHADGHDDDHADGHDDDHADGTHGHDESAAGTDHGHDGTDSTHGHTDGTSGEHGHSTDSSDPGHGHPSTGGPGHEHPPSSDPGHEHPTTTTPGQQGPITSIDDPRLTPAQRAAAIALIDSTRQGMARFPTVEAVMAAGYSSIGDGGTDGYEHFVNWGYLSDGAELDPARIESIVVKKFANGTKAVEAAMYILSLGKTMSDVPDIAGSLTTWHDHTNLCFDGSPPRLVGVTVNGVCQQGINIRTPPMMHVWLVDTPCGPFAGVDEHGLQCDAHEH
jgi:hypothetical protein